MKKATKKEKWNPEKAAGKMKKIATIYDIEFRHIKADDLLCEILTQMGYKKMVNIYKQIIKWYA